MKLHACWYLAMVGLALASGTSAAAQSAVDEKLDYVASIAPERIFYCNVKPRTENTSETILLLEFTLDGKGPVESKMTVTGEIGDKRYTAKIGMRGTARSSNAYEGDAFIVLDKVHSFVADPLPDGARWSDPEGDLIELRVTDYASMGSQPYILRGTQTSEFGINDLTCLDWKK